MQEDKEMIPKVSTEHWSSQHCSSHTVGPRRCVWRLPRPSLAHREQEEGWAAPQPPLWGYQHQLGTGGWAGCFHMRMTRISAGELTQALMPQATVNPVLLGQRLSLLSTVPLLFLYQESSMRILLWKQHQLQQSCLLFPSASVKHDWAIPVLGGKELLNCLKKCHRFQWELCQPSLSEAPTESLAEGSVTQLLCDPTLLIISFSWWISYLFHRFFFLYYDPLNLNATFKIFKCCWTLKAKLLENSELLWIYSSELISEYHLQISTWVLITSSEQPSWCGFPMHITTHWGPKGSAGVLEYRVLHMNIWHQIFKVFQGLCVIQLGLLTSNINSGLLSASGVPPRGLFNPYIGLSCVLCKIWGV